MTRVIEDYSFHVLRFDDSGDLFLLVLFANVFRVEAKAEYIREHGDGCVAKTGCVKRCIVSMSRR